MAKQNGRRRFGGAGALGGLIRGVGRSSGVPVEQIDRQRFAEDEARRERRQQRRAAKARQTELDALSEPVDFDLGLGDLAAMNTLFGGGPMPQTQPGVQDTQARLNRNEYNTRGTANVGQLQRLADEANNPTLRPAQRAEIEDQYFQKYQRDRPEDDIVEPPTIESEESTRTIQSENGMVRMMQPDGTLEVRDLTSQSDAIRAQGETQKELARLQARQTQQQQRADQLQARRQERSQLQQKVRERKQQEEEKASAERAKRWSDYSQESLDESSWPERIEAERKKLTDQFKAKYPKRPVPQWPATVLHQRARIAMEMGFRAREAMISPTDPMAETPPTPMEAFRRWPQEDPESFQDAYQESYARLQEGLFEGEEPSREEVLEDMFQNSPAQLAQDAEDFTKRKTIDAARELAVRRGGILPSTAPTQPPPADQDFIGSPSDVAAPPLDLGAALQLPDDARTELTGAMYAGGFDGSPEDYVTPKAVDIAAKSGHKEPEAHVAKTVAKAMKEGDMNWAMMTPVDQARHEFLGTPIIMGTKEEVEKKVNDQPVNTYYFNQDMNLRQRQPDAPTKKKQPAKKKKRSGYGLRAQTGTPRSGPKRTGYGKRKSTSSSGRGRRNL